MILKQKWVMHLVAGGLLVVALVLVIQFFEQLPIEGTSLGIDIYGMWLALGHAKPQFGNGSSLYISPWAVPLLMPLARLSFRAAWGVVALLTLGALIASVPPTRFKWQRWLGILLLCGSYLTLRLIADGNFDFLVIIGLALIVPGFNRQDPLLLAAGMLLATSKIQVVWLLMPFLAIAVLRTWPRERWLRLVGWLLLVMAPTMLWVGPDWLNSLGGHRESGSIMDSSLISALHRFGWSDLWIGAAWLAGLALAIAAAWRIGPRVSSVIVGLFAAVSMVLAPYVGGNSYLAILAIGVMPLVLTGNLWGIGLLVLANLPFLASANMLYSLSAYYWTAMFLVSAIIFAVQAGLKPAPSVSPPRTLMAGADKGL